MDKKTAVEWFYENTQDYVRLSDTIPMVIKIEIPFEKYINILKQAKEKEKEQIANAYRIGWINYLPNTNAEEYYNQTYNQNKSDGE